MKKNKRTKTKTKRKTEKKAKEEKQVATGRFNRVGFDLKWFVIYFVFTWRHHISLTLDIWSYNTRTCLFV